MVNKKFKMENILNFHCIPFAKNIDEDIDSQTEKTTIRDYSKFKMCNKRQKITQYNDSLTSNEIEYDQEEYSLNPLSSEHFKDHGCRLIPSVRTSTTIGDHWLHNEKYTELVKKTVCSEIDANINLGSLDQTSMHIAAMHNHRKMLKYLLVRGVTDVNEPDQKGRTALHVAACHKSLGAIEVLLKHGANPQAKCHEGLSPMFFAVQSGCSTVVELLASNGCDVNESVIDSDLNRQHSHLHSAVERNHAEMVESLLRYGADVNMRDSYGNTALHIASRDGRLDIARLLLDRGARIHDRDRNELTALFLAVDAGHEALFQLLLSYGARPTDRGPAGATLLHLAVKRGDLEFLVVLLGQGVDVNAVTRFGKTALHYAVAEKNWAALELLLQNGADPNRAEALGKTALYSAIEARRTEAFELLLRHGADPNARDASRQTPLHAAVKQGCPYSVRTLLRHGAEVDAADVAHQTPLHLAARLGHLELLEPLMAHRANIDASDAEGRTALHLAIASEHAKLLYLRPDHTFFALLLRHGANLWGRTHFTRETALHLAVSRRCRAFTRALLCEGAEVDAEEASRCRTSLHLAAENGDVECTEELLVFGADTSRLDAEGRRALEVATSSEVRCAFVRYATRRRVAGLVLASSLRGLEEEAEPGYLETCAEEVNRMKRSRLCEGATYFGFLKASRRGLVMMVSEPELLEAFEQQRHRSAFPFYADMLERNLAVGVLHRPLLKKASARLTRLFGTQLPSVPLERVLSYLNARDMRCLLEAMPNSGFEQTSTEINFSNISRFKNC